MNGDHVLRTDPAYLGLLSDAHETKEKVEQLEASSERTERQLLGSWDEETREWHPGVLQEMAAIKKLLKDAVLILKWIGGVVTVLLTGVTTLAVASWFGLHH